MIFVFFIIFYQKTPYYKAKNFSKKLSEALKGFVTRQDLASQIGITDSGLEKAKAGNIKTQNNVQVIADQPFGQGNYGKLMDKLLKNPE